MIQKHFFFVGIKGVAMAATAHILHQQGYVVSGSDTEDNQITDIYPELQKIYKLTDPLPHDVTDVIYSAAHGGSTALQAQEAKNKGLALHHQIDIIAEYAACHTRSIAVCGCHGKTSTTAHLVTTLLTLGYKISWVVGAPEIKYIKTNGVYTTLLGSHHDPHADIFIYEADEYGREPPRDKTPKLLAVKPTHVICTNIDFDHPDVYQDIVHTKSVFRTFFTNAQWVYECNATSIIENQQGIIALCKLFGHDDNTIHRALQSYGGVKRRLEYHGTVGGVVWYDDYGHHPAEIHATIQALRTKHPGARIVLAFQSHTYSRTYALRTEFVTALAQADYVLIDRIFPSARESYDTPPITNTDLQNLAKSAGYMHCVACENRDILIQNLQTLLRPGDIMCTLGAGDIYSIIPSVQQSTEVHIHTAYSLYDATTWKTDCTAQYYTEISSTMQLVRLVTNPLWKYIDKKIVLGRGANTLFACNQYTGMVIHNTIRGRTLVSQDIQSETWRIGAGEDWHDIVTYFVEKKLGGIENLALIPGTVGAGVVQNVAAYGQSLADVLVGVETFDTEKSVTQLFDSAQCKLAYRHSIFKDIAYKSHVITAVHIRLVKSDFYHDRPTYFSLSESTQQAFEALEKTAPYSIRDMYEAVIWLRNKKLPPIEKVGSNGSIFTNPFVTGDQLMRLLQKFPQLQYYPTDGMQYVAYRDVPIQSKAIYKVAIGHILDKLGWKNKRIGNVGTWHTHALVICNYGTRSGSEIYHFIRTMQKDVQEKTGLIFEPEIHIVLTDKT